MKANINILPSAADQAQYSVRLYNPNSEASGMRADLTEPQKQTFDAFVSIPEFGTYQICSIDNAVEEIQFDIEADKTIEVSSFIVIDYTALSPDSKSKYDSFVAMIKTLAQ